MKAQKLNQRQTKQVLYLSKFDFALKHVASKSMGQADSLSKRADWAEGIERDNKNQIMLKKEWLKIRVIEKRQLLIEGAKEEIIEKIKRSEAKNDKVVKAVEEMKKVGIKVLRNNKWQIEDILALKEEKMYILRNEELRLEIIWLHHNTLIIEYGEQWKTVELVTRNYWQLGVTKEMK